MKQRIKKVFAHPLISGSSIVLVGSFLANILNYGFNLQMGRLLSISDYGVLSSLISIVSIFSVFSTTIITVFTKFTASFMGQGKKDLVGHLFKTGTFLVGIIVIVIAVFLFVFAKQLASFLNITNISLIYITIITLAFSLLSAVPHGILQGLLRFMYYSFVNISSSLGKLLIGFILVTAGWKVIGAIDAFLFAVLLSYMLSCLPIFVFLKKRGNKTNLNRIYKELTIYAFPVFLSGLGMTAIISIDIILVKHFFDPVIAGQYAGLSLMGRSIFYIVGPITFVLFPLIAQKKERNEKLLGTVLLSIFLVGIPCIILNIIYFIFPNIILSIFFPAKEYASLKPLLGPFSLFISFYSLAWLLNSFYLSVGKTSIFIFTLTAAFVEILLISFFHENLLQVVISLIGVSFFFLLALLLYYREIIQKS